MKKVCMNLFLGIALCVSGIVYGATASSKSNEAVMDARVQVAKLRGKLVYKKGQIRKLERAACSENSELKEKVDKLEAERRANYIAAEPKLKTLYAEQDALEAQIKTSSEAAKAEKSAKAE